MPFLLVLHLIKTCAKGKSAFSRSRKLICPLLVFFLLYERQRVNAWFHNPVCVEGNVEHAMEERSEMRYSRLFGLIFLGLFFLSACSFFESDEEKANKAFNAALQAIEGNNTDEAFIHLKNTVKLKPDHSRAHYRLGTLYFQKNEPRMAIRELLTALNHKPDYRQARSMVASFFYGIRRYEEAIVHYQKLLGQDADNYQARMALGDSLIKTEQPQEAIEVFQEAIAGSPEKIEARIGLARALSAAGQKEKVVDALRQAKTSAPEESGPRILLVRWFEQNKQWQEAEDELADLVASLPDQAVGYFESAQYWLRRQNLDQAEQALQQGLDRQVADPKLLHGMALVNHYRQKTDKALDWFQKAAAEYPEDRNSLLLLGDYYLYLQQTENATATYEQIIAKWPEMKEVKAKVAGLLLEERKGEKAEAHIESLVREHPDYARGHLLQGLIKKESGENAAAKSAFSKAKELQPDAAGGHYYYGLTLLEEEDYEKSLSEVLQALEKNPDSTRIRLTLAYIYSKIGRLNEALEELNRILNTRPNLLQARELRSVVLMRQQQFAQAAEDCRHILDKQPALTKIRFRLARALQRQGDLEQALDEFNAVLADTEAIGPVVKEIVGIYTSQNAYEKGFDFIEGWIAKRPGNLQLGLLKGNLLLHWKKLHQAQSYLKQLHEQHPESELPLLLLAQVYQAQDNLDKAVDSCRMAITINPENPAPYLRIAGIYNSLGEWERSIDVYQELLDVRQSFAPAMNDLAYLYALQGINLDRAMELGQKAVELRPNDPNARDTLGFVAYQRGALLVAQRYLREAIEMQPQHPVFHYHLGKVRVSQDKYSQAGQSLKRSLELGLSGEMKLEAQDLLDQLAGKSDLRQQVINLLQEGNVDHALQMVREAQKKAPENAALSFLLGRVYQEKGSQLMSEKYLSRAVELDEHNGLYRLHLGKLLFAAQAFDRAEAQLTKAVKLGLDTKQLQQAKNLLQNIADK